MSQATPPPPPPPPPVPTTPGAPQAPASKPVWKRWWFWVAAVVVVSIIASASGAGTDPDQAASSDSSSEQTESAAPTETSQAPEPTESSEPTQPPEPAEPKPINLKGSGKTATKPFKLEGGFTTFAIKSTGGSNVIVYLIDDRGKKVELLVNVIGTYNGVSGIGVKPGEYLLDIDAPSSWTAVIEQPRPTSGRSPPQSYSGSGPDVVGPLTLDGLTRVTMKYKGNSNFIVYLMTSEGRTVDLLANEIGSFSGSTALPGDGGTYWLTVDADGSWSVKVQ